MNTDQRTPEQIAQELAKAEQKYKELKNELKATKAPSGQKLKFLDDDGKEIEGVGVAYYYVQLPNKPKPIWKKASKCTIIE